MAATVGRTVLALAFVLLAMWFLARLVRKTPAGRTTPALEILGRQQLSKASTLALVRVADRAYLLGVTDGQVQLVGEPDLAAVLAAAQQPVREKRERLTVVAPHDAAGQEALSDASTPPSSALAGSALSPETWRAGIAMLRERSVRRA